MQFNPTVLWNIDVQTDHHEFKNYTINAINDQKIALHFQVQRSYQSLYFNMVIMNISTEQGNDDFIAVIMIVEEERTSGSMIYCAD